MASLATLPDDLQFVIDQGCRLLPGNDRKFCPRTGWPNLASDDPDQIAEWLEQRPASWLMQTGSRDSGGSDRIVVEYDSERGRQWVTNLHLPPTLTVQSGRGSHLHYVCPPSEEIHSSQGNHGGLASDVDVKGWHSVAVIPPTVHKTGRPYAYQRRAAVVLPDILARMMRDLWLAHNPPRPQLQPHPRRHHDPAFELERRRGFRALNQGESHPGLLRSAGKMRRHGASANEITTKLLAENFTRCHPPKSPAEVIQLAHDVAARYSPADGPDPLEVAWGRIHLCDSASTIFKLRTLAIELQRSRPNLPVVLPQDRLADLLSVSQQMISKVIRRLRSDGFLTLADPYIPLESAHTFFVS